MNNFFTVIVSLFLFFNLSLVAHAQEIPSFSGAEGFGAVAKGGRNGKIYHVTNLNDSGEGSFREAVEASGSRIVVFDVSGIIKLKEGNPIKLDDSYITIAGQTAPGDGIIIAGEGIEMVGGVSDVIIRYLRIRRSFDKIKWAEWMKAGKHYSEGPQGQCLVGLDATKNIMIDHVSVSWGTDENMSIYRRNINGKLVPTKNITVQWCLNAEALNAANHAFGSTWGGQGANHHHNLFACNIGRNPSVSFSHFMDYRNNVAFNWRDRTMDGGGKEAHVNVINNYLKPGPATGFDWQWNPLPELFVRIVKPEIRTWGENLGLPAKTRYAGPGVIGLWHVDGNIVEGFPEISTDNWEGEAIIDGKTYRGVQWDNLVKPYPGIGPEEGIVHPEWEGHTMDDHLEWVRSKEPITHAEWPENPYDPEDGINGEIFVMPELPTIATQSAKDTFGTVLEGAGANLPVRDDVDSRIVKMVKNGKATSGTRENGIIDHPDEVGGYPTIKKVQRSSNWDTDLDGMPDYWEKERKLNPKNSNDCNDDYDNDGFTNIEEYLNEKGAFKAIENIIWDGELNKRYAQIENWNLAFQPSRLDNVIISNAEVYIDAIDQHAGNLKLSKKSKLEITKGWIDIEKQLLIKEGCNVKINNNTAMNTKTIINNGKIELKGNAKFKVDGFFINNGILDISKWKGTLPKKFINIGTVKKKN